MTASLKGRFQSIKMPSSNLVCCCCSCCASSAATPAVVPALTTPGVCVNPRAPPRCALSAEQRSRGISSPVCNTTAAPSPTPHPAATAASVLQCGRVSWRAIMVAKEALTRTRVKVRCSTGLQEHQMLHVSLQTHRRMDNMNNIRYANITCVQAAYEHTKFSMRRIAAMHTTHVHVGPTSLDTSQHVFTLCGVLTC